MKNIVAQTFYSGFPQAHDTYNALSTGGDGKIYYVLCSDQIGQAGQFCVFDPVSERIEILGDLDAICGESGNQRIAQGKSHVEFFEKDDKLFFATHVGYYEMIDGMERLPKNPPGNLEVYPGGHFVSYDRKTGEFQDFGIMLEGEGILTMTMDQERDQLYGISWPSGYFIHYDIRQNKTNIFDPVSGRGEAGDLNKDYRVLCRSMFVEPTSGNVYFTNAAGDIFYYNAREKSLKKRDDVHMRLDYFGCYDITTAGSMGYNWRKIYWHPKEQVAYGIHGNSGYLFRFDPSKSQIELIERITSTLSRKYGMYDQFSYGYLGFYLDPDKNLIYYLTGGPILENGKLLGGVSIPRGGAKGPENLHLITFDLNDHKYVDHGSIFYPDGSRPSFVNSIAVDKTGSVYTLARRIHEGREIADLLRIRL